MARWYRQGTANLVQGSTSVTGNGTIWDTQVKAGDPFRVNAFPGEWIEIEQVLTDESLVLSEPWPHASANAADYAVIRNFAGTPNAALAADVAAVIRKYSDLNLQLGQWLVGSSDGGPNSDGFYPITINGVERLVPAPTLIAPPETPEELVARGIYTKIEFDPAGSITTLNLSQASVFRLVLGLPMTQITLTNKPTRPGTSYHATIVLEQGLGGRQVDWSQIANLKWNGGVLPVLSGAAGAIDIVDLLTLDGGNSWMGFYSGQGIR